MKIKILAAATLAALGISASTEHTSAQTLTPEAALDRVMTSLPRRAHDASPMLRAASGAMKLVGEQRTPDSRAAAFYVFSSGDGYVIASADERVRPLLAVVDEGSYDPTTLPPAMAELLEQYRAEIGEAIATDAALPSRSADNVMTALYDSWEPVAVMLTTKWNQGYPYNALTPTIDGSHCATGCTATALAQAAYYHRQCYSQNTRTIKPGNFPEATWDYTTPIDWDNMYDTPDNLTDAQIKAVAQLMLAAGVVNDIRYGVEGSGAPVVNAANIIKYFGYDPTTAYISRASLSQPDFETLLYTEMSHNRPVVFSGNGGGAHAFNVDGYLADGLFHFNWGWGGMLNGYYALTAMTPRGLGAYNTNGYCGNQAFVRLVPPSDPAKPAPYDNADYQSNLELLTADSYQFNGTTQLSISFSVSRDIAKGTGALKFTPAGGGESVTVVYSDTEDMIEAPTCYMTFKLYPGGEGDPKLAAGEYDVVPQLIYDGTPHPLTTESCTLRLTVAPDGKLTFTSDAKSHGYQLHLTDVWTAPYSNASGAKSTTYAAIYNSGDREFCENTTIKIRPANSQEAWTNLGSSRVAVPAEDNVPLYYNFDLTGLATGTYELSLFNDNVELIPASERLVRKVDYVKPIAATTTPVSLGDGATATVNEYGNVTSIANIGSTLDFSDKSITGLSVRLLARTPQQGDKAEAANPAASLTTVVIPENVEWIGSDAFRLCRNLSSIIMTGTTPAFGYPQVAFYGIADDAAFYVTENALKAYRERVGTFRSVYQLVDKFDLGVSVVEIATGEKKEIALPLPADADPRLAIEATDGLSATIADGKLSLYSRHAGKYEVKITPRQPGLATQTLTVVVSGADLPDFPVGDLDHDGHVTVTDVTLLVEVILGHEPAAIKATREECDINGAGGIDVADVTSMVNIILNTSAAPNALAGRATDSDATADAAFSYRGEFIAMQTDIVVADGAELTGISLTPALRRTHTLTYSRLSPGHYRAIVMSGTNSRAVADGTPLLALTLDGEADIELSDAIFTDTEFRSHDAQATGVGLIAADSDNNSHNDSNATMTVYDLRGVVVARDSEALSRLPRGIYIVSTPLSTRKIVR